jgi:tRNA(Ile)-lysidine synthase
MVSVCALVVTANRFPERLIGLDLIERGSAIALGVSGGGDSVALLHMVAAWAKVHECALYAFTVDHNLRAKSADEAAFVAGLCAQLEVEHQTLVWDAPKPSQNAARGARHRLLAEACRAVGARFLLLGHTLDDVVETAAMRGARGNATPLDVGPMPVSVSPVWPEGRGILILRPFILSRRSKLREWLRSRAFEWVDDPSNENDAYERPRVRKALADADDVDVDAAVRALQGRARVEVKLAPALRACAARCDGFGLVRVSAQIEPEVLEALIPILVPAAAGTDRIPKAYARLSAMTEMLEPDAARYTIGGAWLQRSGDDILIGREPARDRYEIHDDVFDGRFVRDLDHDLPDYEAPYLLRRALPPERSGWRSLMSARLEAQVSAFEVNARLLTRPRVSDLS